MFLLIKNIPVRKELSPIKKNTTATSNWKNEYARKPKVVIRAKYNMSIIRTVLGVSLAKKYALKNSLHNIPIEARLIATIIADTLDSKKLKYQVIIPPIIPINANGKRRKY